MIKQNHIYVFQFFPGNQEGPVTYDDHYEGILLKKQNKQYKVAKFLEDIPDEIVHVKEEKYNDTKEIELSSFIPTFMISRVPVKNYIKNFTDFYFSFDDKWKKRS